VPGEIYAPAWFYFGLNMVYLAGYITLLSFAPVYSRAGTIEAIILGFAVPFYVFQSLYAFTVYVQHTHPRVPWFNHEPDRSNEGRQEFISVHLEFPLWVELLVHHVYNHGAHHVCPAIPCYQLSAAQARLNDLLGDQAITDRFSFAWLFKTMKICKLYDYKTNRWMDFNGCPTSKIIQVAVRQDYANAA
jgi:omega-6 fatty acid desaturase (delta-12 desaturase)